MQHPSRTPWFAAILVLLFSLGGCSDDTAKKDAQTRPILQSTTEVLRPFVWFYADSDNSEANFRAQLDYGDPLQITTRLIQDWIANRTLDRIDRRVAAIVEKWQLDKEGGRMDYSFDYGKLKAGWYSGMDSWSFPMFLIGIWQETGRLEYRSLAEELIRKAARDVGAGGTVWRGDEGCWFSEYAWDGMSQDDEFHVLNGHLYSLQSVRMLATALNSPDLEKLYRCGVQATKTKSAHFLGDGIWPLYMLNPRTIDQTHYVIYETMQFDALYELDRDPFFQEQAAARRKVLQRQFPVYVLTVGDERRLTLSAVGAPHPYAIDTYALELECADGSRTERYSLPHPTDTKQPLVARAMLDVRTNLDPSTTKCRVTSEYVGFRFMLYDAPVRVLSGETRPGADVAFSREALFDAWTPDARHVVVDPGRRHNPPDAPDTYLDTQGRLVLTPDAPIPFGHEDLLGFEFDADGPLQLGVIIHSRGRDFFRYYPATRPGDRTLVLLSPLGFDDGTQIASVDRVTFFFYTDKQAGPVRLTPGRLTVFRNAVELYEYFRLRDPNFYTE
ncbi:MAG: D-glucuronyl C5-epimerase family protein [Burkholderiaceae bacterium]|nr:D-glucuronyl C5-epimerase family protein [Burkholderiaceae bacterium]